MADVFLSYKREDAAKVRMLVAALQKQGFDPWWDEDIPPSAPWEATIEQALAEAKAVIVCWSPASVASENVRSEARVAREDGRLIQLFMKPCTPPLFFGERQGVDLSKWRGNPDDPRIGKIAEAVRKVASGERIKDGERTKLRRLDKRARVVLLATLALIIAAIGLVGWRSATAHGAPEVAVLPFEDLSPTHDKAYFAEGVAEEILSSLSTEKAIKVLGRTSSREIDKNADPKALRRSLGITHLVEGSARTAGDALRVDVRLIDTRDGTTLWQDEYHGRLSDVFAFQDRIASAVVQHMRGLLAPVVAARPVTKVNVYETYLAARSIMRKRSEPSLKQALVLAQQVIATDPNYAPGQALYAELIWLLSDDPVSYGTIPASTARHVAEIHARAAIRLAPKLADGYAALGLVVDDATAIDALRHAIALDPSRADARVWLALRYENLGRYDDALQVVRDAAAMEPLWPLPLAELVTSLTMNGHGADARAVADQYRARGGSEAEYHRLLLLIYSRGPNVAATIAEGEKAYALDPTLPDIRVTLLSLFHLVGIPQPASIGVPPAFVRVAEPFFRGNVAALNAEIRSTGTHLWELPDRDVGFFHLAAVHDWTSLNQLYDARPVPAEQLCFGSFQSAPALVQALIPAIRAAGRQRDEEALLGCLRTRLTTEAQQKARSPNGLLGDYEFNQATLAAFQNDKNGAVRWLDQAVARGWMGRPYSSSLADRPQFDALHSDPRLAGLQAKIDRAVAVQRANVLAQLH